MMCGRVAALLVVVQVVYLTYVSAVELTYDINVEHRNLLATTCGTNAASSTFVSSLTYNNAGVKVRRILASGCPGYDWTGQTTPNVATIQNFDFQIAYRPVIASIPVLYLGLYKDKAKTTPNTPFLGSVGIAINGVVLYGNSDADSRDAYVYEGSSFDSCKGHASQVRGGQYHYHVLAADGCTTSVAAVGHSPLFAFMYDGVPVFGEKGDNGIAPTDLDECNGHVDITHPYYHYHAQSPYNVYPYLPNCLKGCVNGTSTDSTNKMTGYACTPAVDQYNYTAFDSYLAANFASKFDASAATPAPPPPPPKSLGHVCLGSTLQVVLVASLLVLCVLFV